jgi:prepilin-type N-terminal cleavage/methylation domain-containing protein
MNSLSPISWVRRRAGRNRNQSGFTFPDLIVVLAVLAVLVAIGLPIASRSHAHSQKLQCTENLHQVSRAILMYADEHRGLLPRLSPTDPHPGWWWYKEQVKGYVGLRGRSSRSDRVFACPSDRGYDEGRPFCQSDRFDFQSYVFNGVTLPGMPNIAGGRLNSLRTPAKTLLVMEWTAHAPLSWHDSKTGNKNHPFYSDAESVVAFADGQVNYIKIYYDGVTPAYARDPIPGYDYRFSGD